MSSAFGDLLISGIVFACSEVAGIWLRRRSEWFWRCLEGLAFLFCLWNCKICKHGLIVLLLWLLFLLLLLLFDFYLCLMVEILVLKN